MQYDINDYLTLVYLVTVYVLGRYADAHLRQNKRRQVSEILWGKVKDTKTGNCSHMSEANMKMGAIVYSTARMNDARIRNKATERLDAPVESAIFVDDDVK